MAIDVAQFKGEAPRLAPRLLPDAMGQATSNPRLISGNIEPWSGFLNGQFGQNITTQPVTIWFMNDQLWLSWNKPANAEEVDVAKEAIAGDNSWRTIFCDGVAPRFTDLGLASGLVDASGHPITGSSTVASNPGPYPINSRKLGVSNPTAPSSADIVPAAAGSNTAALPVETFDSPVDWNLAPNTAYTGGSFQVVGGNPGANMAVTSIGAHEAVDWKAFAYDQTQYSTLDFDVTYGTASNIFIQPSYTDIFVGCDTTLSGSVIRLQNNGAGIIVHFASVSNGVIGGDIGSFTFAAASIPTWYTGSDSRYNSWVAPSTWGHISITVTPASGGVSATITLLAKVGSTTSFSCSQAGMPNAGSSSGIGCWCPTESYPDWIRVIVDNWAITGIAPAAASSSLLATSYLYTLVNDLGEESGPSPAMLNSDGTDYIERASGQAVRLHLPATLAAALTGTPSASNPFDITYFQVGSGGYIPPLQLDGVTRSPSMNIYRAVTGSTGTTFMLVAANVAFGEHITVGATPPVAPTYGNSTTEVIDQLPDSALQEVLQSTLWYPPPPSMLGILALPNGIYAGFSGNNLCLSAQGIPHAWPLAYQLTFDYNIVGMEAIDSTIVVCTKDFPYLCAGNSPDAYSQTKASYPYRCASKRSIKYLKNVGVVFATYEGLVSIAGPGQENLLTESLYSKREWTALNPASMIAAINDNRYFCWYTTTGGAQLGFYIDTAQTGAGKVSLSFHATARYQDPLSDTLYMVRDAIAGYPTIEGFDQDPTTPLPYSWKSKQFYVPHPTVLRLGRVTADSYLNTTLSLFSDGVQWAVLPIASQREFILPEPPNGVTNRYLEFQVAGTDKIDRVQLVEDAEEFL